MNNNNPAVAVATARSSTTTSHTAGSANSCMSIESSDIIRLIHAHLIESGLHNTAQTLRAESGVGSAGVNANIHSNLFTWCKNGQWGEVLESLSMVDTQKLSTVRGGGRIPPPRSLQLHRLMADIHEVSILELADVGEYDLARAILRVVADELDDVPLSSSDTMEVASSVLTTLDAGAAATTVTAGGRSASIERRIQALITLRSPGMDATASTATTAAAVAQGRQDDGGTTAQQMLLLIPPDYYGENNISKQKRREEIGRELVECIPIVPHSRLLSLLQQAVKWQAYTGQLPMIRECWDVDDDDDDNEEESKNESSTSEEDETSSSSYASDDFNKEKKKKKKRKKHEKKKKKKQKKQKRHGKKKKLFDLVLGEVDAFIDSAHSGDHDEVHDSRKSLSSSSLSSARKYEKMPTRPYAEIKFSKRSHVEIATFLPDGTSLITGSSDGFIEIWGEKRKKKNNKKEEEEDSQFDYTQLRTSDLPYQRNDEALLVHEDNTSVVAVTVSHDGTMIGSGSTDGTVKIWKFTNGKCLRQFHRAMEGSVSCLQFGPDGSRVLVSGGFKDGICREFGLRTSKMLKEFRGHDSFVNVCAYVLLLLGGGGSSSGSGGGGASGQTLLVVTGSADGTVRVWDGRTSEVRRVIRPSVSPTDSGVVGGVGGAGTAALTAMMGSGVDDIGSTAVGRSVHTVLPLHSPADTMIVVPRETRAYLMTYGGAIIRVYERDDVSRDRKGNFDFVTATVSPTNKWLYVATEDGVCCCFNVGTGKLEKMIRNFAEESAGGAGGGSGKIPEVTGLAHHPHKGILASYSNDKGQKRGLLTLWK